MTRTHRHPTLVGILLRVRRSFKSPGIKSEITGLPMVVPHCSICTVFSNIRMPLRLAFGAWWIPRNDNLGEPLLAGTFETNELTSSTVPYSRA